MTHPTPLAMVFTDIEGSTRLAGALGHDWREVVELNRKVSRRVWGQNGGREVDTAGDGFFVTFPIVAAAVTAAVQVQRELTEAVWPGQARVRVRVGVHHGPAVEYDGGYVGLEVHRAARITGAAHGGQVLASAPVVAELSAMPLHEVTTTDLGRHLLRDLPDPEHLFQICAPGLPSAFPPVRGMETEVLAADVPATFRNDVEIPPAALRMQDGRDLDLTSYGIRIGRTSDNDLVLADPKVSRHHCAIAATGGGFVLTDLQSTHGSWVNRERVERPQLLADGDELRLGDTSLRFRWPVT